MPTREQWKKVYGAAHFGCLVSWFVAPVMTVIPLLPDIKLRKVAVVCAGVAWGFVVICAVIGNISHRKSQEPAKSDQ